MKVPNVFEAITQAYLLTCFMKGGFFTFRIFVNEVDGELCNSTKGTVYYFSEVLLIWISVFSWKDFVLILTESGTGSNEPLPRGAFLIIVKLLELEFVAYIIFAKFWLTTFARFKGLARVFSDNFHPDTRRSTAFSRFLTLRIVQSNNKTTPNSHFRLSKDPSTIDISEFLGENTGNWFRSSPRIL